MLYLLIISWLLSPLVLIPLTIVQCRKKEKLHRFVSELLQKDRIDYMEYSELRVRNEDTAACPPSSEAEAPIFSDAEKHNSILKEPARQPYTYHEYTPAAPKPGFKDQSAVHSDKRSENAAPASPEKRTGKKGSAGAMSVLMTIGIIFVILAGVVFSTAVWVNLGNFGRACAIGIVSALFFVISAFAKKKLSLDSTAFAFYTLGSFFAAITLITAGFFRLLGSYLSVDGGGSCILFAIAAIIISLFSAKGRSVFNKAASAYISVFSGAIAAILLIIQFSDNAGMFALLTALLSLVVNTAVFAADLKISDNWEKPVRAASAMVYAVALICGIVSVFTEQTAVYACSAVYVLRSVAAAFMGFKGHRIYKKQFPAAVSLISGIFFSTVLMWKLSGSLDIFALALTIFAIAFTGGFFTFKINVPDEWNGPVKLSAALLNTAALLSAFAALFGSFGEWNGVCYAISALYILQSIAVTAMAFKGHHVYSKCGWAAFAHFTGILFSAFLLFELAPHERCFILLLAVLAVSYTIAADIAFMKIPEGWLPVTKVSKVILNIAGALVSASMLIEYNADWDIYCIITAALYIAYTAFFGIRYEKKLLTAAECIISSFSLFNLYCLIVNRYENSPVLILVSMLFGAALIHHFAKPVRTAFSDIFLTAAVIIAALYSTSDDSIFALIGFAVLGILLLINSAERERSLSRLFGALLPLPVSGIVFTAIEMTDIYFPFSYCTAANAAVLAAIAAAVLILTKRSGAVFYSFAVTASVMVLLGTDSGSVGIRLLLIAVGVLLTALFGISANNLPSLLSMVGTALALEDIADKSDIVTVHIITAAIFAAVCLAASRVFFPKKVIVRKKGMLRIDSCCTGILLAIPMLSELNGKVETFAVLALIAIFAANLARRENHDDFNRAALTVGFGFLTAALIERPFLTLSDPLFSDKITLGLISIFGFVFSKLWKKYPKLSENVSTVIYGFSFICLIIEALEHEDLFNTLIVLGVSLTILLYSFSRKKKRWFAVSSIALTGLTLYIFRDFFRMIDWWVYLLAVGLLLIAVASANEYFIRKGRELKEKAGRFFEDWTW